MSKTGLRCSFAAIFAALAGAMCFERIVHAQFNLVWEKESGTFPTGQGLNIDALLFRVQKRFEKILESESTATANPVTVKIRVRFAPITNLGETSSQFTDLGYATVKETLREWAEDIQFEGAGEVAMYTGLPDGATLPVVFANGLVTPVGTVKVNNALYRGKWQPNAEEVATIELNSGTVWDYWAKGKVDPGTFDLENTVTHEVIHALGFDCAIDANQSTYVHLWDMFRLSNAVAGGGVQAPVYNTASRMLQPGIEAVAVTGIGAATTVYRLSTGKAAVGGDGWHAGHWKQSAALGWIGVMMPTQTAGLTPGLSVVPSGYLKLSDIRALDMMGWNLIGRGAHAPWRCYSEHAS